MSVPALASFAIFQFLWVWNDLLVALLFLGPGENQPLTVDLAGLLGSQGQGWELLTAGGVRHHGGPAGGLPRPPAVLHPRADGGCCQGMSRQHLRHRAARHTAARWHSHVHLHTDTVSLLLAPDPRGACPSSCTGPTARPGDRRGRGGLPRCAPPVPHAGPDQPYAWRLLPLPADGWPVRPGLVGAGADGGRLVAPAAGHLGRGRRPADRQGDRRRPAAGLLLEVDSSSRRPASCRCGTG